MWQKRKCSVHNCYLTIAHATVSLRIHSAKPLFLYWNVLLLFNHCNNMRVLHKMLFALVWHHFSPSLQCHLWTTSTGGHCRDTITWLFFFFFFFSCSSSFMQPNKPPTRLNLLTCQVKPSVEDKKCFDLISRTTHTNKHMSHANPFPSIITDLAFILLLLSFCLATTLNFSQDINLNFESKMSFLRSHLSTRSFIISFDVNKPLCDTFKQSDGCKHTRCN